MELLTILNHCHHHRGFVYQNARFGPDKKSIEVDVRPRKGSKQSARGATSLRRVTIVFPSGALSSSLSGEFWFSFCIGCGVSTAAIAAYWWKRSPGAMRLRTCRGEHQLTRAYTLAYVPYAVFGPLGAEVVLEGNC